MKENRYRKTKIRAVMVQDDDYGETNIKVLKFIETNENEEISRQKVSQENKETTEKVKDQGSNIFLGK